MTTLFVLYWKINMCYADMGPKGGHWRADKPDCTLHRNPSHLNLHLGFAYTASCPSEELCVNNVDNKHNVDTIIDNLGSTHNGRYNPKMPQKMKARES